MRLTDEGKREFAKLLASHPGPWRAERSNVYDANGAFVVAIEGSEAMHRWLIAAMVANFPQDVLGACFEEIAARMASETSKRGKGG